jgi:hypothetical protein
VQFIKQHHPEHDKVYEDLAPVQHAKDICLEVLSIEAAELKNKLQLTMLEYEQFKSPALKKFLDHAQQKIEEILKKQQLAEMSYENATRYTMSKKIKYISVA